jgi:hypothetical protein
VDRAVGVPIDKIPFPVAEGMVAYATKQADMYRELARMAEITRTEVKLQRGKKRRVFERSWDPVMPLESEAAPAGEEDEEDDNEEDDERGDVESDEELLMGGEVDD